MGMAYIHCCQKCGYQTKALFLGLGMYDFENSNSFPNEVGVCENCYELTETKGQNLEDCKLCKAEKSVHLASVLNIYRRNYINGVELQQHFQCPKCMHFAVKADEDSLILWD